MFCSFTPLSEMYSYQLSLIKKIASNHYIFCVNWKQMNLQTMFPCPSQLFSHFLFWASVWIWWEFLLWAITAEQWAKDTNEVQTFKVLFQKSCTVNALKVKQSFFFFFSVRLLYTHSIWGKLKAGNSQDLAVSGILNASWYRLDFLTGSF